MQIRQLRLKNLNSLVGEWEIDLTHPDYASSGIFAITGPTGAGKSTILDALCLALYGTTPRLGKITQADNEIMSRQTGECFAEATFVTAAGRYRCHWSQHRARRKPDGKLQAPKHELAEADSGRIMESKQRGVAEQIETVTGMDFDRFTRSMLLAQGGFAAFLQADPDQRAPILEQITGTGIYSLISIKVHQRRGAEQRQLENLERQLTGIRLLPQEEEEQLQKELTAGQEREKELAEQIGVGNRAIGWLDNLARLAQELAQNSRRQEELQQRRQAFAPQFTKLQRANQALELAGAHAALAALRQAQQADRDNRESCRRALPALEAGCHQAQNELEQAEQQRQERKNNLQAAQPLLRQARELDLQLRELAKPLKTTTEAIEELQRRLCELAEDQKSTELKQQTANTKLQEVDRELTDTAADQQLVEHLAAIEERFSDFAELSRRRQEHRQRLDEAQKRQQAAEQTWQRQQQQVQKNRRDLQQAEQELASKGEKLQQLLAGKELTAWRRELLTLKEAAVRRERFLESTHSMEQARGQLRPQEPCPLCGSRSHPFANGEIPDPDPQATAACERVTKLVDTAEELEKALQRQREAMAGCKDALNRRERESQSARYQLDNAQQTVTRLLEELRDLETSLQQQRDRLLARIAPYGIKELTPTTWEQARRRLTERRDRWQTRQQEKNDLTQQLAGLKLRGEHLAEQHRQVLAERHKQQEHEQQLQQQRRQLSQKRQQLLGEQDPEREEQRLQHALEAAEKQVELARQALATARQEQEKVQTRSRELAQAIDQRAKLLAQSEAEFKKRLAAADFADEAEYLAANLPEDQRRRLQRQAQQLADEEAALSAGHQEKSRQLQELQAQQITTADKEELQAQLATLEEQRRTVQEQIGALKQKLEDNRQLRRQQEQQVQLLEAQRQECARWELLHELIGSADGKKFRNFAQGLTFEVMVGQANHQLKKMTDRYLLLRDPARPLELNVVDNYQAGEIRPTRNLSGGESFLVSLALALGLSRMASRNVQVDSLFLDEGFGTLDDEALDSALETLAGLQQDGKLIGIISHVPALKERIATRIRVVPQTGGRSSLSGPGITHQP
ncbi:AAA family ATPase [Desulfurivibrio alkaliphilus]|uniref:SMC domain protein n=1 Tax=Desulfurivibrio alkaliphilus (strain DSM 19089 / UNIQEM U267 / AHT2) TaxID=589865 RepID=D6Z2Z7_DESAT|nr:AAA family ATPase [Desulfurivibrio alkaliphilus]ADH85922.1 SMC domain protein [Desulfurivibrio alkaliphilus AHT 2]